jgi:glycosyltransferase involved in cell wall biosynthesis
MRVLIVSQYFWPENFPINSLAVGLRERGHLVTVLTAIPNYPSGRFFPGYGYFRKVRKDYGGIKVLRVPLVPRGGGGKVRLAINYLSFALSSSLLAPLVCRGKYDLIFVWESSPVTIGLPALVLKRTKSAPIMFWVQDLWPESLAATGAVKSPLILRWVDDLVRFIYRGCDRVLVQSRAFSPRVEKQGVEPRRILYFPNWAEELYRPVDVEPDAIERKEMPDGFRILFAGNIGAAQDFGTILAAAERLKEHLGIQWMIMGDGRMRSWVEDEIRKRELGRTVHLLGRRPAEAMPRYFSLVDVLLVTLRKEPIFALTVPSKVQSYLACAKPILAALEGEGARVIEEAGAGLSVAPEDSEALAEAALALYRTPEIERNAMGLRGRKYSESHFERRMLLDCLECWMNELRGEVTGGAPGKEG